MAETGKGAPALEDVKTDRDAGSPMGPAKPHGDKLGVAASNAAEAAASEEATAGDSPKRHGDPLQHAVQEAAKR